MKRMNQRNRQAGNCEMYEQADRGHRGRGNKMQCQGAGTGPKGRGNMTGRGHRGGFEQRAEAGCQDSFKLESGIGRGGRGHGKSKRRRLFRAGDLQLVTLNILQQQPSHGYDVIKALQQQVGGDYKASPGTIYPTLNLLEDQGYATATLIDGGRKQYQITPTGSEYLQANSAELEKTTERLQQHRARGKAQQIPQLHEALEKFRAALGKHFANEQPDQQLVEKVAAVITRAADDIEQA